MTEIEMVNYLKTSGWKRENPGHIHGWRDPEMKDLCDIFTANRRQQERDKQMKTQIDTQLQK